MLSNLSHIHLTELITNCHEASLCGQQMAAKMHYNFMQRFINTIHVNKHFDKIIMCFI